MHFSKAVLLFGAPIGLAGERSILRTVRSALAGWHGRLLLIRIKQILWR